MCFYIDSKHQDIKTASKDIVCYKVMYERKRDYAPVLLSPFIGAAYDYNKLYELSSNIEVVKCFLTGGNDYYGSIYEGFHSYTKLRRAVNFIGANAIVVKCIIPKGTKYYLSDEYDEYVSDKIIITEKLMDLIKI